MPLPISTASYQEKTRGLMAALRDGKVTKPEMKAWVADLRGMHVKPDDFDVKVFTELFNERLTKYVTVPARKVFDEFVNGASTRPSSGSSATASKAAKAFDAYIKKVQSRLTEEIRVEDSVRKVEVSNGGLKLTLDSHFNGSFPQAKAFFASKLSELGFPGVSLTTVLG